MMTEWEAIQLTHLDAMADNARRLWSVSVLIEEAVVNGQWSAIVPVVQSELEARAMTAWDHLPPDSQSSLGERP